jgi:hypothetical protein
MHSYVDKKIYSYKKWVLHAPYKECDDGDLSQQNQKPDA